MVKGCPICGSRRWRRDNVTGSAVCEDGHVYQDFRVENQDADGPSQYALQRRKIKSRSKGTKKDQGGKNEAYYIGDDAEYLRIQALQLLLRYQVQALRKLWDLPEVFEMIVRDLWTYQLAISVLPSPPEEHAPSSRSQTPVLQQPQPQRLAQLSLNSGMDIEKAHKADNPGSESDGDEDMDEESKSDKADEEPEVDLELLEEMSHLSELSDKEERYGVGRGRGRGGTKGETERKRRRLKVSDTLVMITVGLWMIRRGTLCVDIENIVHGNQIPYLDFAHTTLLPSNMKKHMNRDVVLSLSPIRCPAPKYLFGLMRLFAPRLQVDFGLNIPDINLPQISWRLIGGLGGTPVIHSQVVRLLDMVDINLNLVDTHMTTRRRRPRLSRRNSSRGRSHSRVGTAEASDDEAEDLEDDDMSRQQDVIYRRTNRYQDIVMPELAVVGAWVVIMKMAYGLDGGIRRVTSSADPAVGLPMGPAWTDELGKRIRKGSIAPERDKLEKHDFSAMPIEDMDRFLNSAEDVLLKDRDIATGSDTQTFPLLPQPVLIPPLPPPTSWRPFHETSPLVPPAPTVLVPGTGLPPEPAEEIRTYDPKDPTGSYPTGYETVLSAAAAIVGAKVQDVVEVVSIIERRLEKARKQRRTSMSGRWGVGRPKSRSRSRSGVAARELAVDEEEGVTDLEDNMA